MSATKTLAVAAVLVLVFAGRAPAADEANVKAGRTIDLVICLDISGSMEGLIESAKIKLWSIVNDLALIQPPPKLRVAVYTYGCDAYDHRKGWVQKDQDLTTDLDEVYRKLNAFRTNGGTEYAARVARDALIDLEWSKEPGALKMVFVCGNEPATQDPEISTKDAAAMARRQGVFINTIYCRPANHPEAQGWKAFAEMAGGKYCNIDQDRAGKAVAIKTPWDAELLTLGEKLNTTYCFYGAGGREKQQNQVVQDANAAKAAPGAALERSVTKSTALYRNDAWDLVDRSNNDPKFDIRSLKDDELPEELKKLKPEERVAYVKAKADERARVQKQVAEINGKRSAYIASELKKQPQSEGDKALDEGIKAALREQAASVGIEIPE